MASYLFRRGANRLVLVTSVVDGVGESTLNRLGDSLRDN